MQIWRLLVSINWISSTKEMNPITWKSISKLAMKPSFRSVGQTHAEWQTFEKIKRQMYGSQAWVDWLPYIWHKDYRPICFKASPGAELFIWKFILSTCKWSKNVHANKTSFDIKSSALGLALKRRKWVIIEHHSLHLSAFVFAYNFPFVLIVFTIPREVNALNRN